MKGELILERPRAGVGVGKRQSWRDLWHFASEYLLTLPVGAAIALLWANIAPDSYFRVTLPASFLVNDVAMVFFFALMTKEIVEATVPGGVLHPWRRAVVPVVASVGVAIVPLLGFSVIARAFDEPMLVRGWPAVLAIDVAAAYFLARLIFGRHPAVPFLLLVTLGANAFGFLALAMTDPIRELRLGVAIPFLCAAIILAQALRWRRVTALWPYALLGGGLSWCGLFFGGLHPALAALPIVPFLPHATRDRGFFVDADSRATDTLSRLEQWCRHPAQVALLLFGLVNAGVPLIGLEIGLWSLPLATLIGKPLGLLLGAAAAVALGLHLPRDVGWRDLTVLGMIAAVGFTMALFFATATLGPGHLLAELKVGALLSLASGAFAIAAARALRVGRFRRA